MLGTALFSSEERASHTVPSGFSQILASSSEPSGSHHSTNPMRLGIKLIVDLIFEGGVPTCAVRRRTIAEYHHFSRGRVVIDEHLRAEIKRSSRDIQSGRLARKWAQKRRLNGSFKTTRRPIARVSVRRGRRAAAGEDAVDRRNPAGRPRQEPTTRLRAVYAPRRGRTSSISR
jgi:Acetohydroxy acid isomeroreductase, catalytic domain